MNKKAVIWGKLLSAVILLVLLLVFVFFLIKVRIGAAKMVEDSQCKSSIISHIALKKVSGEGITSITTDIYCPTKYYTLPGKTAQDTNHQLAEAMKTCWGTWGKGELDLFKGEGSYCHICSVIDFKNKDKKFGGLKDYLINTKISPDSEQTYMGYLAGFTSEDASPDAVKRLQENQLDDTVDTSKSYAVIFAYAKGQGFMKSMLQGIGSISGLPGTAGGGLTAGLIVGVGTTALLGLGFAPAVFVTSAAVVAGAALGFTVNDDDNWVSQALLVEYNEANIKEIGCQASPIKQDTEKEKLG